MRKKSLLLLLSGGIVLSGMNTVHAESFEGRETEMNNKCAVVNNTVRAECARYKEYLESKSKDYDAEIGKLQVEIDATQGDISKIESLMKRNQAELDDFGSQIDNIQTVINTTQASITSLDEQVVQKSENISKRDALMKEQMTSTQSSLGMNEYADFLMGSSDFIDLIRRSQALGELHRYEKKEIIKLAKEKEELANDKRQIDEHTSLLEIQIRDISNKREKVVALHEANNTLLAQYRLQEATLLNEKRTKQMAQANIPTIDLSIADSFDKVEPPTPTQPDIGGDSGENTPNPTPTPTPTPPPASSNFISPLQSGWHYESGTWQYPGGGGHMGMDFSTGRVTGIPVIAPADGIIIYSYNGGCDNNGNSGCGVPWGGGNNTLLLTKKGDTIYAMPFYHLTSASRSAGTRVNQGEIIGYSGNSGNSTGPHCHVEVIRVGVMSMADALGIYNRTNDLTFGTGWNADAPKACGTAPCRERPENYWRN